MKHYRHPTGSGKSTVGPARSAMVNCNACTVFNSIANVHCVFIFSIIFTKGMVLLRSRRGVWTEQLCQPTGGGRSTVGPGRLAMASRNLRC